MTKLNPFGAGLVYSSYLGGNGVENGIGIAVDILGNAYTSGTTNSTNFPTTPGAFQTTYCGGSRCHDAAERQEAQIQQLPATCPFRAVPLRQLTAEIIFEQLIGRFKRHPRHLLRDRGESPFCGFLGSK